MAVPPHLNFNPSDFQQARQGGAVVGAQSARLQQSADSDILQAQAAQARMQQEAQIANARIQQAQAQLSQQQILAEMAAKTRQEIAQQNHLKEQQQIANQAAYQNAQIGLGQQRIQQAKAISDARARDAAMRFAAQQDFSSRMARGESVDKALYANPGLVTPSTISAVTSATRPRPDSIPRADRVRDESLKTDIDEIILKLRDPRRMLSPSKKQELESQRRSLEQQRMSLAGGTKTSTSSSERVRVKSPNGKVGTIPASQLDEALRDGYTQVQ
jgi:hypothetical protein